VTVTRLSTDSRGHHDRRLGCRARQQSGSLTGGSIPVSVACLRDVGHRDEVCRCSSPRSWGVYRSGAATAFWDDCVSQFSSVLPTGNPTPPFDQQKRPQTRVFLPNQAEGGDSNSRYANKTYNGFRDNLHDARDLARVQQLPTDPGGTLRSSCDPEGVSGVLGDAHARERRPKMGRYCGSELLSSLPATHSSRPCAEDP
jgi:hypothetical protein